MRLVRHPVGVGLVVDVVRDPHRGPVRAEPGRGVVAGAVQRVEVLVRVARAVGALVGEDLVVGVAEAPVHHPDRVGVVAVQREVGHPVGSGPRDHLGVGGVGQEEGQRPDEAQGRYDCKRGRPDGGDQDAAPELPGQNRGGGQNVSAMRAGLKSGGQGVLCCRSQARCLRSRLSPVDCQAGHRPGDANRRSGRRAVVFSKLIAHGFLPPSGLRPNPMVGRAHCYLCT